ncbi:MAG: hypothetical protein B7Y56_10625 [Gallionellales bacterium 35-53-114]|jgi:uncharacterized membrane protein|nr:MAG: hypothetical protein B7Y56_10625 [Gallionellales bacterium 35-53-114]OYZ64919.1 MAG: hypothetical protein B7Y04_03975 [Gallionellales bacterium 24-53-125]OZB07544.1 MAG: hypothetical protein B7X61_13040 [Gallionellales bacterium 39-52-133]HQS58783.1 DUF2231 domain-containing protein [Gallionellaceae bacterium]HQS75123.1 DUF2231 domain-containing protein [Gallionellaceae bacterium]
MIQILPNWHPIFVHFTVALLSLAVLFSLVNIWLREGKLKEQWRILARWNLWLGTAFGIVTALAGWDAYNTVMHDAPSHAAMTVHLYWALATLSAFVLLSLWSAWNVYNQKKTGILFLALLLAGGGLLVSTAWHGGELVYRYGLGVMSLPQAENDGDGDGHDHDHAHETEHVQETISAIKANTSETKPATSEKAIKQHSDDGHAHDH